MSISKALIFVILPGTLALGQDLRVVRPDGIGPAKIGMTLPQLNAALHEHFAMPKEKDDQGCFYASPRSHPQLAFMIEDGHLTRVDVNKPGTSTVEGIQVGDTEARAKSVYGRKLKIEPSKYARDEGGHYLTLQPANEKYGVRLETEKGKITEFYAGTDNAIQYFEGCE
jgi:hypothetical protein